MPDAAGPESGGAEWEIVKDLVFQWETDRPSDLDGWLRQHCPTDDIRREVERLARAAATSGDFLENSAAQEQLGLSTPHPVHIGRYRVIEELGAGGSGVVYSAYDPSLERKVAIKCLTSQAAGTARHRKRLRWDAKAASATKHPNIVTIHDFASGGEFDYIVMECVDGRPLGQIIAAGIMPLQTLLHVAIQIVDALAAAHRSGVIHRDLKPNNIMVSDEGVVKVLDFGLAKQENPTTEDTSLPTTIEGHFAGTVAYVSPEQAEGKSVDSRADIFSFGCILYEMLTGKQAFQGQTALSVVGNILHQPAPVLRRVAPQLDERFDVIVQRCLRKQPADRYASMEEIKGLLEEMVEAGPPPRISTRTRRVLGQAVFAASLFALIAATALWMISLRAPIREPAYAQTRLTTDGGVTSFPAISQDGRLVAYASDRGGKGDLDLWVQQWDMIDATRLTFNSSDDYAPSFNPLGTELVYRSEQNGGGLYEISTMGGNPVLVAPKGRDGHFSPDGNWLAYWKGEVGAGLLRDSAHCYIMPARNGQVSGQEEEFPKGFDVAAFPVWSATDNAILFFGRKTGEDAGDWWVVGVDKKVPHRIGIMSKLRLQDAAFNRTSYFAVPSTWLKDNTVLFSATALDATNIWAVRIDAGGKILDEPHRWSAGTEVEQDPDGTVTPQGRVRIVYAGLTTANSIWRIPLKATGHSGGDPELVARAHRAGSPSLSLDGQTMMFSARAPRGDTIQLADLKGAPPVASTTVHLGSNIRPVVSGDGHTVAWWSSGKGYEMEVNRGAPQVICAICGQPTHLNFDGSKVIFEDGRADSKEELILAVKGQSPRPLFHFPDGARWMQAGGRFSPDEKWVAFSGWHEGDHKRQILVAPVTADGTVAASQIVEIVNDEYANREPVWSPDGRRIYFLSDRDGRTCVWAQDVDAATKHPEGERFAVFHFHNASLLVRGPTASWGTVGLSASSDFLVLTLTETRGNIWGREQKQ